MTISEIIKINTCPDERKKIYRVTFDSSDLLPSDTWDLCSSCNESHPFVQFRKKVEVINNEEE